MHTNLSRKLVLKLVYAVILTLLPAALLAQTTTVQGVLRDPQDKVVPGADITLISAATGVERTTITNEEGGYQFAQVAPGTYQLKAELSGFKSVMVDNLRLQVDTPATLDLKFTELGEVSETVVVTAEQLLNKVDASMGNPFTELQIKLLPVESRNVFDLLSLQAGVTQAGYVTGSRSDQSNLTLDGIDVNEQQTGEAFESVLRVTPDSVQEFKVTTTNPNASQGRSSGAQVSLVTKSGTNEFHGSAYEYNRNTAATANNFFNNRVEGDPDGDGKPGIGRPALVRNLFGGSLGGPIKKDKVFFFFNYEGRKDRSQATVVQTVPLAHLGEGKVKYQNLDGQTVTLNTADINALFPDVGVNPLSVAVLKDAVRKYPANDDSRGDQINTGGFRFNAATPLDWNAYTAKLDFNLTEDHVLSARANYQWDHAVSSTQYFPDTPSPTFWSHPTGLALAHTWTMSNSLVNTFRYGLTREAFSSQGDSSKNSLGFREVFWPYLFSRTLDRTTPLNNFTDDLSWTKGEHTFQFGANIRRIRNNRADYSNSWDYGTANFFYYENSGAVLVDPIPDVADGSVRTLQKGLNAVIGRLSQYGASYNYAQDGGLLSIGSPNARSFGTEEYEVYGQDSWRVAPSLTLTYGLRWGVNSPVYEASGYQVKPTVSLSNFFERRVAFAKAGTPLNELITVDTAGPFYKKPGWYEQSWKNFSPRVAAAWSPSFDRGVLGAIFGSKRQTVIRGGFSMLHDRIGSALAVSFDLNNTLGFSTAQEISANTFNVTDRPGPLFTGWDMDIRKLPAMSSPSKLTFPLTKPADEDQRIEMTLDDALRTPVNYTWNLSWGRELPKGLFVEASYVGRAARNLMAQRDVMHLNNLVDPKSGMDWYTAAWLLEKNRLANTPVTSMQPIPYFENLFPNYKTSTLGPTQRAYRWVAREAAGGWELPDYTYLQLVLDDRGAVRNLFFHPQYAALSVWSTIAYSDYHAFTLTARERFKSDLMVDFNYTWSKSMDNASGLQRSGSYATAAFIMNPLRPDDSYSLSNFDIAHMINANWLWALPVGKGKTWLSSPHPVLEAVLGNWEVNGIFRWNSGLPEDGPFTSGVWPTNWNLMTNAYRTRDPGADPTKNPVPYKDGSPRPPNFFQDPGHAHASYRTAGPGEVGDRNVLRLEGYVVLDLGIGKSFRMPYNENHRLNIRWDVFNVTNTQRLGGAFDVSWVGVDPALSEPEPSWFNITNIQGSPRVMQFALRYDF